MIITEPKWKSYVVETTGPIFTPEQCKMIIEAGRSEPKQTGQVAVDRVVQLILKLEPHISAGFHLRKCWICIKILKN